MDLAEVRVIDDKIESVIGEKAWGVRLGVGSLVTLEFGKLMPSNPGGYVHGEWHLWIRYCAWRLERLNEVISGSDDERDDLANAVQSNNWKA